MTARRLILASLVVVGVLAVWAPFANASKSRLVTGEFGVFAKATGVAVDQMTGYVYVVDGPANEVDVFKPTNPGEYEELAPLSGSTGSEKTPAESFDIREEPASVAVYDKGSNAIVYVTDPLHNVVDKFEYNATTKEYTYLCEFTGPGAPCVASESELGAGEPFVHFQEPGGVAVDSEGNVYIASYGPNNGLVDKFNAAGLYQWGLSGETNPEVDGPVSVAADTEGNVYVVDYKSKTVKLEVGGGGAVLYEGVLEGGESFAVAVEQSSKHVLVDIGASVIEFESMGDLLGKFGAGALVESDGVGIYEAAESVYVSNVSDVAIFGPPVAAVREPTTLPASSVEKISATLNGVVDTEGEIVEYFFQYGPCATLETCSSSPYSEQTDKESGMGPAIEVKTALSKLAGNTVYHYRLVAASEGREVAGNEIAFETLPAVAGVSQCDATSVGDEGATLLGALEPLGTLTNWSFQYGETTGYETGETSEETSNSDFAVQPETKVTGLEPNMTYHCRLIVQDEFGTTPGRDGEFKTLTTPATVDEPPPAELASEITRKTVVLHGAINPENSPTQYFFRYGKTSSYGSSTSEASAGQGFGSETVQSERIEDLQTGTTYHFALEASHAASEGGTVTGPDYAFTTAPGTPPVVGVGEASAVTQTSATISDTINPESLPTTYEIDLGTDTTYGGARIFGQVVEGHETIAVNLEDLAPGTTYLLRVLATNEDGTVEGPPDQTFMTPGVTSPITEPLAPPLLATPLIAFPTEQGKVIKPRSMKKSGKSKKRHRAKPSGKRKAKDRVKRRK